MLSCFMIRDRDRSLIISDLQLVEVVSDIWGHAGQCSSHNVFWGLARARNLDNALRGQDIGNQYSPG